jgi:fermentation-respiration switch protein FrsA (DUF1100 family)
MLFFPTRYPIGDWDAVDLQHEDVWFEAEDGTRLHGWYSPCVSPRATVLLMHGNAGNIATRVEWLLYLQRQLRVTTFCFDYRGYGRSAGAASTAGLLLDARAARARLRELAGIQDDQMLLMGESIGGALAVHLAAESAPQGLILQSAFTSLREIAAVHYPGFSWIVPKDKFDSCSLISKVHAPLLLSHGTADTLVPFRMAEKLFRAANEPKHFVAIDGANHNDWLGEEYLQELSRFIDRVGARAKKD